MRGSTRSNCVRRRPAARGFTLVEFMAASVVTVVIGSIAATMLIEASRARTVASLRAEMTEEAARSIEQILRHVREIDQDVGLTGLAQISVAESARIVFGNFAFRLNGTDLEMSTDSQATWNAMARDASALTFAYYTANGSGLTPLPLSAANREAVRQVSVEVNLARGSESVRARSRVYLRSFMNEAS